MPFIKRFLYVVITLIFVLIIAFICLNFYINSDLVIKKDIQHIKLDKNLNDVVIEHSVDRFRIYEEMFRTYFDKLMKFRIKYVIDLLYVHDYEYFFTKTYFILTIDGAKTAFKNFCDLILDVSLADVYLKFINLFSIDYEYYIRQIDSRSITVRTYINKNIENIVDSTITNKDHYINHFSTYKNIIDDHIFTLFDNFKSSNIFSFDIDYFYNFNNLINFKNFAINEQVNDIVEDKVIYERNIIVQYIATIISFLNDICKIIVLFLIYVLLSNGDLNNLVIYYFNNFINRNNDEDRDNNDQNDDSVDGQNIIDFNDFRVRFDPQHEQISIQNFPSRSDVEDEIDYDRFWADVNFDTLNDDTVETDNDKVSTCEGSESDVDTICIDTLSEKDYNVVEVDDESEQERVEEPVVSVDESVENIDSIANDFENLVDCISLESKNVKSVTINNIKGDILNVKGLIAHCISLDCYMGAGLALSVTRKYPQLRSVLLKEVKEYKYKIGSCVVTEFSDGVTIANLITKPKYHLKPTYETLGNSLVCLKDHMICENLKILNIPKNLACGHDRLNWDTVLALLKKTFTDDYTINIYELVVDTHVNTCKDLSVQKTTEEIISYDKKIFWLPFLINHKRNYNKQWYENLAITMKVDHVLYINVDKNHKIIPEKDLYVCTFCTDIFHCKYYKLFDYKFKDHNYLTKKLTDYKNFEYDFIPFSCDYEYMYNAMVERIIISKLTINTIKNNTKQYTKELLDTIGKNFDERIENLKRNELVYKNVNISVYNYSTNTFLTKLELKYNYFSDKDGNIVSVRWEFDKVIKDYILRILTPGYDDYDSVLITYTHFEIYVEPEIYSKLKQLMIVSLKYLKFSVNMINGLPGCGKTTRTIKNFKLDGKNMIACATRDAANDVRDRLLKQLSKNKNLSIEQIQSLKIDLQKHVRTIDSVLVNEEIQSGTIENLFIDEALMRHPGEIFAMSLLLKIKNLELIGDMAQIPYVNRISTYVTVFNRYPYNISERLYISYRCPPDVVACIENFYDDRVFSARNDPGSMSVQLIKDYNRIDRSYANDPNTKILVFKQSEKQILDKHFGKKVVNTVHEYQGQQCANIILVRLSDKPQESLYLKENYALVAISRHTKSFTYLTYYNGDAVCKLIKNKNKYQNDYHRFKVLDNKKCFGGGLYMEHVGKKCDTDNYVNNDINVQSLFLDFNNCDIKLLRNLELKKLRRLNLNLAISKTVECGRGYMYEDYELINSDSSTRRFLYSKFVHTIPTNLLTLEDCDDREDFYVLQSEFDRCLPGTASRDRSLDMMLLEDSDLNLNIDNLRLRNASETITTDLHKTQERSLKPSLHTICPVRRVESLKEILLGIQKRNANVPDMQGLVNCQDLANKLYVSFIKTYIDESKYHILDSFSKNLVGPTQRNVRIWFRLSTYNVSYLHNEYEIDILHARFDRFQYTIKPNPKPIQTMTAGDVNPALQTISAHEKYINCVFSPTIKIIKDRIKSVLKDKYLIFTDESIDELKNKLNFMCNPARLMNLLKNKKIFFKELDISKFDKSQGQEALIMQCAILKLFGASADVVDYYFLCNILCKLINRKFGVNFTLNYQMKSGTAVTLLFNTLYTMTVNSIIYSDEYVLSASFCGDDAFYILDINFKNLINESDIDTSMFTSTLLNLETKELEYTFVYFCSKFLIMTTNGWFVVPDPLKLLNKLGRNDILDYEHLEEYRVSTADNYKLYNDEVVYLLDFAISERYNIKTSNINMILALYRFVNNKNLFKKLFYEGHNYVKPHSGITRYDLTKI